MDYTYEHGDEKALVARLGPHFTAYAEPLDVQLPLHDDPVWEYLRPDLQVAGLRLLRLELEEDARNSSRVALVDSKAFQNTSARLERPTLEEQKLWKAAVVHPDIPPSMEVTVRDLLLSTGVDTSPGNAERVINGYWALAHGPRDRLHIALSALRANTIARSRNMLAETEIRFAILTLAERALTENVFPGISLRHAGAVAEPPRGGVRPPDELKRLTAVLDHIENEHRDPSTIDWVAKSRLTAAQTDTDRDSARRRHIQQYIAISDDDTLPFRAMIWAEKAAALASEYGIQDLHDVAVVRMQKLSRSDLGWHHRVDEIKIPTALFRQQARQTARFSSWEQALALFLARESPAGKSKENERRAATLHRGVLDLFGGRTFGAHQLPERTHGPAEVEHLAKLVQMNLNTSAIVLRTDLDAIADRFEIPPEGQIAAFLTTIYGSTSALATPFARALLLYWRNDPSSAARLAIPLIEAGARELLFLMDAPLYRTERGASPGRFPAMDFYVDKLEQVGFDPDWAKALRATLLGEGMNLRNRLAHGFKLDFTAEEAALSLRLAGLFIAMPVGTGAISDDRARTPLRHARKRLHRRLGWVWR